MSYLVLVSGGPGAGKTTLAPALAAELGLPLLAKDTVKEALGEALPPSALSAGDHDAWSRALGIAAFEVLYALIPATAPVVVEAHWYRDHAQPRLRAFGLPVLEVFCRCPVEVLVDRYRVRAASGQRHPVHRLGDITGLPPPEPVGLGPVLEVDTTEPVDVVAVARWVKDERVGR